MTGYRRVLKRREMQVTNSLGLFTNYPQLVPGLAGLTVEVPHDEIRLSVIKVLCQFNGDKCQHIFSIFVHGGEYQGKLGFKACVADGLYFDYLDVDVEHRFIAVLSKKRSFETLDFLFVVIYHYARYGRLKPGRFDYNHLCFLFIVGGFDVCLFHYNGIRWLPLDEVLSPLLTAIKEEFRRSGKDMVNVYQWSL